MNTKVVTLFLLQLWRPQEGTLVPALVSVVPKLQNELQVVHLSSTVWYLHPVVYLTGLFKWQCKSSSNTFCHGPYSLLILGPGWC